MRVYKNSKIYIVLDTEYYWNSMSLYSKSNKELRVGTKVFTILPSLCLTFPWWKGMTHNSNTINVIFSFLTFWFKFSIYYNFTEIQNLRRAKSIDYTSTVEFDTSFIGWFIPKKKQQQK